LSSARISLLLSVPSGSVNARVKGAVGAFTGEVGIGTFLLLCLPLAADGKAVSRHGDLEVLLLDPGNIGLEDEAVLGLLDLEVGRIARGLVFPVKKGAIWRNGSQCIQ